MYIIGGGGGSSPNRPPTLCRLGCPVMDYLSLYNTVTDRHDRLKKKRCRYLGKTDKEN